MRLTLIIEVEQTNELKWALGVVEEVYADEYIIRRTGP